MINDKYLYERSYEEYIAKAERRNLPIKRMNKLTACFSDRFYSWKGIGIPFTELEDTVYYNNAMYNRCRFFI